MKMWSEITGGDASGGRRRFGSWRHQHGARPKRCTFFCEKQCFINFCVKTGSLDTFPMVFRQHFLCLFLEDAALDRHAPAGQLHERRPPPPRCAAPGAAAHRLLQACPLTRYTLKYFFFFLKAKSMLPSLKSHSHVWDVILDAVIHAAKEPLQDISILPSESPC